MPKWYAQDGDDASYKPSYFRTNWHEPVGREIKNTMENVSVADISAFAKISIKGNGATKFLDYMVANKLPKVWLKVVLRINDFFFYHPRSFLEWYRKLVFVCLPSLILLSKNMATQIIWF